MVVPQDRFFCSCCSSGSCSRPGFSASALRAEERINWLKAPAATTSLCNPPPLPSHPTCRPNSATGWLWGRLVTSVFKIEGYEAAVQVLSDGTINCRGWARLWCGV